MTQVFIGEKFGGTAQQQNSAEEATEEDHNTDWTTVRWKPVTEEPLVVTSPARAASDQINSF